MLLLRLLSLGLLASCLALPADGVEQLRSRLLDVTLDPASCYRVRDLFLERDDVKFYFTDGLLIFAESVDGREVSALFLADEPSDQGEILLIPPTPQERASLNRHIGDAVLNQKFRHTMMLFTDDAADVLRQAVADSPSSEPAPERGAALAKSWSPVLRNILEGVSLRLLADLTSDIPKQQGFFAAAVGGGPKGRFDVLIDPRATEQLWVGQVSWRDGRRLSETWCEFEGRTFRQGIREPVDFGATIERYTIETELLEDLSMEVTARLDMTIDAPGRSSFPLDISRRLEVTAARVDGEPAGFLQLSRAASDGDRRQNTLVLLTLPGKPEKGETFAVELDYRGTVIERAGNGVYMVGSRGGWYPRGRFEFSRYELTFHHPAHLEVVATGDLIGRTEDAGRAVSRFRADQPIRLAGFNLGSYVSTAREIDDYRLEVRANLEAEERLQAPAGPVVIIDPATLGRRRGLERSRPMIVAPERQAIRPSERIEQVADQAASAFRFLLEKLGPPPLSQIAVTPIPGFFGQGFPGLVYAATLSYLDEQQPPLADLSEQNRFFYSTMLLPHELSHQWWGNLVTVDNSSDGWILEALATYSSLLYIEKTEGSAGLVKVLRWYRDDLLRRTDSGATVDETGPISMGERLRTSGTPAAYQAIVYEKGAWVLHMLRRVMGDDAFDRFLRSLTEDFAFRALTGEQLRLEAAQFLPENHPDPELKDFFDQWVHHTGIPRFSTKWKQRDARLEVTIRQQDVPDNYVYPLTLEIETGPGRTVRRRVATEGETTTLEIDLEGQATAVRLDPDRDLLSVIE